MLRKMLTEQRLLVFAGAAFALMVPVFGILALVDPTEITGVGRWIKPLKFAVSIAIYLWTLAAFMVLIEGAGRAKRIIAFGSVVLMFGEIVAIVMQATRGVRSHFNISTPIDGFVFSSMGFMILTSTLLAAWLLVLLFRERVNAPPAVVWGMRFGVMLMLAASVEGGYMSQHLAHSVGVADGGPGLPLANWSRTGGDLRVAHFVGLHGLQAAPLAGWLADKIGIGNAVANTTAFSALYFAAFTLVFVQALIGRPLF